MTALINKVPSSPTTIFFSFLIRFMNSKSTLKLRSRVNILLQTFHTCYCVENIGTFEVHLTSNAITFPVTMDLKVLSNAM